MADFMRERDAGKKTPNLPKPKQRLVGLDLPRPPKKKRAKRDRALAELLRDFRLGLTSLRSLSQRLRTRQPDYKGQRGPAPAPPPAITKIVERERRVIEKVLAPLPTKEREVILREYERVSKSVMQERAPQAYAAILRGASLLDATPTPSRQTTVTPAKVLRPNEPRVKELMMMAKAIRSGRLPFLPKGVVTRARELLSVLFGKQRAADLVTSRDTATRRLISRYRLIPRAVQAAVSVTPKRKMTRAQQELQAIISGAVSPKTMAGGTSRTAPVELAQLEAAGLISPQSIAALPKMHTGGAAGPGEVIAQDNEGVQVFTPPDALSVVSPTPGESEAPKRAVDMKTRSAGKNVKPPPMSAPPPAKSATPIMGTTDPAPPEVKPSEMRAKLDNGSTAQSPDSLKVEDISELSEWITRTDERLRRLNG